MVTTPYSKKVLGTIPGRGRAFLFGGLHVLFVFAWVSSSSPTINILWCVPLATGHWVIDLELVPGCPPILRDKYREQVSIRCAEYDCM